MSKDVRPINKAEIKRVIEVLETSMTQISDLAGGWPVKELVEPPERTKKQIQRIIDRLTRQVQNW